MDFVHIPVLLDESINGLNIKKSGIYIDGTIGGAGHSKEIAKLIGSEGLLIGIDQDINAINAARENLKEYGKRIKLINDNFKNMKAIVNGLGINGVDGILLDLGVSSHQLDEEERGFSYMKDAELDMRMDRRNPLTAEIIVNEWPEQDIFNIIRDYGEERWAKRIAEFIGNERAKARITSTLKLVEIIKKAIPASARREGPHPAKRTFQALRIAVNDELGILEKTINDGVDLLKPDGRLCIITFHSLEDRIVKTMFNKLEKPCTCPPRMPQCICGQVPLIKAITRKPIVAGVKELDENSRSRSAKLRVAERLGSK
ncbi:16S rRNA (cytosine(1402)-N(4))-methyltransferase RsmH [Lutispora saccharofermentans]|uniref:Ribosomal RNA small subunit methyltransferase H n=1 Tax=Lutispora saccharofermentans TaxID=3024236 RepID=A0ABT1NA52_9FIRM|nr:16S rRNA (cytosine(1402)-N(4))-methyltransferase RsmH [Lutispora saccharofermentans]MCQ1528137.1 16S rRNA (cytosine(1402)-N(4))-methyltransferase RsmH [Lutispora saccharofermentans]